MTKRYMLIPIASFLLNISTLEAQEWTEMSDPVRPYVTRLTDGNSLSCGLATQEEMASIREAIDRMPPRTPPSGKYALAPPAANISVNYTGFTPEARGSLSEGCRYLVLSADYDGPDRNRSELYHVRRRKNSRVRCVHFSLFNHLLLSTESC